MRPLTPGAALLLCLWALPLRAASAPEACPFKAHSPDGSPHPIEDRLCGRLKAFERHIKRLTAAASFGAKELSYFQPLTADPASAINAWYHPSAHSLEVSWAFLEAFEGDAPAAIDTLAHEIGHAVQDREGAFDWDEEGKPEEEVLQRSRVIEAQADAIGTELLSRAGYPASTSQASNEQFFDCTVIRGDKDAVGKNHPAPTQRWLNSLKGKEHLASGTLRVGRIESRLNETLGRSETGAAAVFDGAAARSGETPAFLPMGADSFKPKAGLNDFDAHGRLLPGRMASADLRAKAPPPNSGAVRQHAYYIRASYLDRAADAWQKAVDWAATSAPAADLAVQACGKASGQTYGEAVSYGAKDWAKRAAEDVARWLK
ncbi:MAG: hypothetical protein AAB320_01065 [Elusimicrobiota bacterium]